MQKQTRQHLTSRPASYTRARLWFECVGCLHRYHGDSEPSECLKCGMQGGYCRIDAATMVRSRAADNPELTSPVEYLQAPPTWEGLFPRGIPTTTGQLWFGGPGTGKSRLAMRLCTKLGRTLVLALEMGEALTAQMARESGADMSQYWGCSDIGALWHDLPFVEPLCVVVDSVSELPNPRSNITRLCNWARDTGGLVIFICQVNSSGKARGGPAASHKVDIEFELRKSGDGYAKFVTRKNRFALPDGQPVFWLGAVPEPKSGNCRIRRTRVSRETVSLSRQPAANKA